MGVGEGAVPRSRAQDEVLRAVTIATLATIGAALVVYAAQVARRRKLMEWEKRRIQARILTAERARDPGAYLSVVVADRLQAGKPQIQVIRSNIVRLHPAAG